MANSIKTTVHFSFPLSPAARLSLQHGKNQIRALNHKLRQQILEFISARGRVIVTEVYTKLRLEQSVASQQLAILRKAGIVDTEREGKFIFYSVNADKVSEIIGKFLFN